MRQGRPGRGMDLDLDLDLDLKIYETMCTLLDRIESCVCVRSCWRHWLGDA